MLCIINRFYGRIYISMSLAGNSGLKQEFIVQNSLQPLFLNEFLIFFLMISIKFLRNIGKIVYYKNKIFCP